MEPIQMPKVSIIILSYNAKSDVLDCLKSVLRLKYPNYEIIVVDNCSTDGSFEVIRRMYPNLKLIRSKLNIGRTGGYNLGLRYATGKYVLFLDQDTTVDQNMVTELVNVIEADPSIGAVGPKIYYFNDPKRIWSVGTSVNLLTGKVSFLGNRQIDEGQFNSVIEVQQHPTAILVKRELVTKIGGHDEDIFMVYCDADFCLKIWELGYKIVLSPYAKLWHKVRKPSKLSEYLGMKSPLMAFLIGRNRLIFMKKHTTEPNFLLFLIIFLPAIIIFYSITCIIERKISLLSSFWKGTLCGLKYIISNKNKSFYDVISFLHMQERSDRKVL
jgi:GT2 family glycosyltransferase